MDKTLNLNYFKDALSLLTIITLILIIFIPFDHMSEIIPFLWKTIGHNSNCVKQEEKCDIFSGKWVPWSNGPYYTNNTLCNIDPRQNCMKNGRPDTDFMKWRWQPNECELPLFDGKQFLELVRGKSMAFVGDSLARNQLQSLGCLLSSVTRYNETNTNGENFESWYYPDYNFTLANIWSAHLVKSDFAWTVSWDDNMNVFLDEADMVWSSCHIDKFDYVIISSGEWFNRPLTYYIKGKVVGCNKCKKENVTELNQYFGYKFALETAFKTLYGLRNFKGKVFLRTISPSHFERGNITELGFCLRKQPAQKADTEFNWPVGTFYMMQKEEFRLAKIEGKKRGLKFDLLDITDAMLLRPDGHPNRYRPDNKSDCLHWCLPGPIDTWNEFLLHKLKSGKQWE